MTTTNELAVAIANATELEKAELAQRVLASLQEVATRDDDATKRLIVGALRSVCRGKRGGLTWLSITRARRNIS